jgi:hypothetical protein
VLDVLVERVAAPDRRLLVAQRRAIPGLDQHPDPARDLVRVGNRPGEPAWLHGGSGRAHSSADVEGGEEQPVLLRAPERTAAVNVDREDRNWVADVPAPDRTAHRGR